ncbi:MAG: hypothetical protein IJ603_00455 [Bacteroidales bacterium]|nr:hypothetical protein [Bacteroidales bacterium]MBR1577390.1 hypothetical protein [Bacteroidales bacterium]
MEQYQNVFFRPWIGERYKEGLDGQRILVLGESHYCSEIGKKGPCQQKCCPSAASKECRSFTEDVIREFVYGYFGASFQQTFLCFERAVSGKVLNQEDRVTFWNKVAFYNYLQYAQSGPSRGLEQPGVDSSPAFLEVLESLQPDKIIVWGKRLYNILPDWGGRHSSVELDSGEKTDVWFYTIGGKDIPAMVVNHPCTPSGKNWGYWHQFYAKFLNNE